MESHKKLIIAGQNQKKVTKSAQGLQSGVLHYCY